MTTDNDKLIRPAERVSVLLVPGLLHPPRGAESCFDECPRLTRWLAGCTVRRGAPDLESALHSLFELGDQDLGLAALRFCAEFDVEDDRWIAFADPVHLRVDPNRALLFGPQLLQLDAIETKQLQSAVNERLREEHLSLSCSHSGQWYLSGNPEHPLQATALGEVVGRNAEPFLPVGDGAAYWRSLLNELQMLMHAHPVNQLRIDRGVPEISGVWPWGAGRLPKHAGGNLEAVDSDDPGLVKLAELAGIDTQVAAKGASGPGLVSVTDLERAAAAGDVGRWCDALFSLERDWPLLSKPARGCDVELWPLDGHAYRKGPWRPWRRPGWRGLSHWLEHRAG